MENQQFNLRITPPAEYFSDIRQTIGQYKHENPGNEKTAESELEIVNISETFLKKTVEMLGITAPLSNQTIHELYNWVRLFVGYGPDKKTHIDMFKNNPEKIIENNKGELLSVIDSERKFTGAFKVTVKRKGQVYTSEKVGPEHVIHEGLTLQLTKNNFDDLLTLDFSPELPDYTEKMPLTEALEVDSPIREILSDEDFKKIGDIILDANQANFRFGSSLLTLKTAYYLYFKGKHTDNEIETLIKSPGPKGEPSLEQQSTLARSYFSKDSDLPFWAMYYSAKSKAEKEKTQ